MQCGCRMAAGGDSGGDGWTRVPVAGETSIEQPLVAAQTIERPQQAVVERQ